MKKSSYKKYIASTLAGLVIAGNVDLSVLAKASNTLSLEARDDIFQAHLWETNNSEGIIVTDNGPDFTSIGGDIKSGDNIVYNDIDFKNGELNTMMITLAALNADRGKTIEIRLDSPQGEVIGTTTIDSSNDLRVFKEHYIDISSVSGVHDIAIVFKDDMNVELDFFVFSEYDGTETPEEFDQRMQWFRDAKFGQFIHWGAYAQAGGEYKGQWVQYSEWIMDYLRISKEDYANDIAKKFNPKEFNAEQVVKLAKEAGQEYLVFTTRHHEGFSMYDTEIREFKDYQLNGFGDYNGSDPTEELAKECKKQGVKFGTYYTIYDWHDKSQENLGNYIDPAQKEEYKTRMKGQLREIIEKYDTELIWFDGEWPSWWTKEDGREFYKYLRTLKPSLVINNRVGKKHPDDGDYGTPEQEIPPTGLDYDWESCMTLNRSWGYHKTDENWKSPQIVIDNLVDVASKGGNYLLNVGPDEEGRVPQGSANILKEVGTWLDVYGESIYGTRISCFTRLPKGVKATTKEGKIYLHFSDWQSEDVIKIPAIKNNINSMKIMGTDIEVNYTDVKDGILIETPKYEADKYETIIEIDVDGKPEQVPSDMNINLAPKAVNVQESNYHQNNADYKGSKAVDGDENTRWATDDNTKNATLDLTFESPITFNKANFKAFESVRNKINAYNIEYWDGEKWVVGFEGGQMTGDTQVTFDPITSDKIRLNVTDALNPSIYEFQIFNEEITSLELTSELENKILSSDGFEMAGTAQGGTSVEVLVKSNNTSPITFNADVNEDGTWKTQISKIGEGTKNVRVALKDKDGSILEVINTVVKVRDKGTNFAMGKNINVSSEYTQDPGYDKTMVIDGDLSTRWAPANGDKTPTMTVDFGQKTTFDTVIISEMLDEWVTPNAYRCLKFKLEYNDGTAWKVIEEGTTIGKELELKFKPVTGNQVRLTVLENTPANNYAPANILEFEVYNTNKEEIKEDIKKVENLRVEDKESNALTLKWDAPKAGTEVENYIIFKDGKEVARVNANENLEFKATNLKSNTLYGFKVVAQGIGGSTGKAVSVNARTAK